MRFPAWFDGGLFLAVAALAAIVATPLGEWMTSTMLGHVLVQIPIVVAAGFFLGLIVEPRIRSALRTVNAGGIPGILLVSFTIAFWMVPRWLDGSLTSDTIAVAKYLSLALLAGMPLA